jgi:hypothetical protein
MNKCHVPRVMITAPDLHIQRRKKWKRDLYESNFAVEL